MLNSATAPVEKEESCSDAVQSASRRNSPWATADGYPVYVGGIPSSLGEEEIKRAFSLFGEVLWLDILRQRKGELGRGFAFVHFLEESAQKACLEVQNETVNVNGNYLRVATAKKMQKNTLYIGKMPPEMDESRLAGWLRENVGEYHSFVLKCQRLYSYCFVKFESNKVAIKAKDILCAATMEGIPLHVGWADSERSQAENNERRRTVYISNLAEGTTSHELRQCFSQHGPISSVNVVKGSSSGDDHLIAFVIFETSKAAFIAAEECNGTMLNGIQINSEIAKPPKKKKELSRFENRKYSSSDGNLARKAQQSSTKQQQYARKAEGKKSQNQNSRRRSVGVPVLMSYPQQYSPSAMVPPNYYSYPQVAYAGYNPYSLYAVYPPQFVVNEAGSSSSRMDGKPV